MPTTQPNTSSENGRVATVEFITGSDRWEVVLPIATDNPGADPVATTTDALHAIKQMIVNLVMPLLGNDTSLLSINVEGMVKDTIPDREDYAFGSTIGGQGTASEPTSVAVMTTWYPPPIVGGGPGKTKTSRNFWAGVPIGQITNDVIASAYAALWDNVAAQLIAGFTSIGAPRVWYRVGKAVRITATQLPKLAVDAVRRYVVTQRKRMIPR